MPAQGLLAQPKPLAAERLRPTGGTTDFWLHSFHAKPIGLMLKSSIQPGARCPSALPVPPPMPKTSNSLPVNLMEIPNGKTPLGGTNLGI